MTCLLSLEDDLKSCVPWPPALLEHELGEEICCVLPPGPDGVCVTQLVHCGPRVRCAAEWFADVRLDLGVTRGVQLYRNAGSGKPWKNLQRLLRQAKMGQVGRAVLVARARARVCVCGGGGCVCVCVCMCVCVRAGRWGLELCTCGTQTCRGSEHCHTAIP